MIEEIARLVDRLAPAAICADCVVATLNLSDAELARQHGSELAGRNAFERTKDVCGLCGNIAPVLRKRR